jgi:hypothetical protein
MLSGAREYHPERSEGAALRAPEGMLAARAFLALLVSRGEMDSLALRAARSFACAQDDRITLRMTGTNIEEGDPTYVNRSFGAE